MKLFHFRAQLFKPKTGLTLKYKLMKPLIVITLLLLSCSRSFGQAQEKSAKPAQPATSVAADTKFEKYCLDNATRVITAPEGKAINLKISGEVTLAENNTYRDYNIVLKENETQYFTIAGTNQLLAVNSIYRLRVAYNAEKH
jgi:hypothetical protein